MGMIMKGWVDTCEKLVLASGMYSFHHLAQVSSYLLSRWMTLWAMCSCNCSVLHTMWRHGPLRARSSSSRREIGTYTIATRLLGAPEDMSANQSCRTCVCGRRTAQHIASQRL